MPKFSGWRRWDKELGNLSDLQTTNRGSMVAAVNEVNSKNNIKTYTTLEQMGLSDTDMSPEDFAYNLEKIDKTPSPFIFVLKLNSTLSNISKSVKAKLLNDLGYVVNFANQDYLKIERYSIGSHDPIKIEIYGSVHILRQKSVVCYADKDGNTMNVYPFREVAYIEKSPEIELLNGWEKYKDEFVISKIGDYVSINLYLFEGVRTNGTTIFNLPMDFRPKSININIPIQYDGVKSSYESPFITIKTNGNAEVYYLDGITSNIKVAAGFPII